MDDPDDSSPEQRGTSGEDVASRWLVLTDPQEVAFTVGREPWNYAAKPTETEWGAKRYARVDRT